MRYNVVKNANEIIENSSYLIVITQSKEITKFEQHKIYKINKYEILPIKESEDEKMKIYHQKVIKTTLDIPSFYYSYSYDLTRSYQTQKNEDFIFENCDKVKILHIREILSYFMRVFQCLAYPISILHGDLDCNVVSLA